MKTEIQKSIRSNTIKKRLQVVSFIVLGITNITLLVLAIIGIIPSLTLLALIPFFLMMYKNVQMWDLYNDVIILQKYIFDEDFRQEYNNSQND